MKTPLLLSLSLVIVINAYAGSAIWNLNPTSGDWNTAANWTPATVPNGPGNTATFDASNTNTVSLSRNIEVNGIVFNPDASAFTVMVPDSLTLSISGSGLTNDSATIQNFVTALSAERGTIQFSQNASAGNLVSITNDGGQTTFIGSATAGTATIINDGALNNTVIGGWTQFFEQSSAGRGTFISNGGAGFGGGGGRTLFFDTATAGDGTFILNGGIPSGAGGGIVEFAGSSTAGNGTFIVNSSSGAQGGLIFFADATSAGDATFTLNDGALLSFGGVTADNATFIINGGPSGGAHIVFSGGSTGGRARVEVFENGTLDIRPHDQPGLTIGSLEGNGQVLLDDRPQQLTVGTNNLSTTFSGVIVHRNGSLSKVGTGALTLSGNNAYGRGTTIEGGKLVVNNMTGSGTGTGVVQVNAGRLCGRGTIAGAVTVGSGSGAGAALAPGRAGSKTDTLTILSALTFQLDSIYQFELKSITVTADRIVANGVTINKGAQFSPSDLDSAGVPAGTVFTPIDNTAATPITGTFATLPDGSTITVGTNTFQANYEGGDGNDLTLTVVP